MDVKEVLTDNTDEIIALSVVIPTVATMVYQAVMGMEPTMTKDLAMIVLGFYFVKKAAAKSN